MPPVSLNGENGSEAKMKKNEDTADDNYADNFKYFCAYRCHSSVKLRRFSVPKPARPEPLPSSGAQREVEEEEITHQCVAV